MEVPDPIRVLQSIFGAPPRKQTAENTDGRPEELVEEVDFGSLSLEEFADEEKERNPVQPTAVQSIEQCMSDCKSLARQGKLMI